MIVGQKGVFSKKNQAKSLIMWVVIVISTALAESIPKFTNGKMFLANKWATLNAKELAAGTRPAPAGDALWRLKKIL